VFVSHSGCRWTADVGAGHHELHAWLPAAVQGQTPPASLLNARVSDGRFDVEVTSSPKERK